MTAKDTEACIKDLAFALRRLLRWARLALPAPESDQMILDVEKRLSAIAARLGSD